MSDPFLVFNASRERIARDQLVFLERVSRKNVRVTGARPAKKAVLVGVARESIGPLEHGEATRADGRLVIQDGWRFFAAPVAPATPIGRVLDVNPSNPREVTVMLGVRAEAEGVGS